MESALTSLIPSLVKDNVFGEGEFVCLEEDSGASIGAQFSSSMAIVNLKLRGASSGETKVIPIVVKVQSLLENDPDIKDNNTMFYNEVLMYKELLPFLDVNGTHRYPKMYYGYATHGQDPAKDVLIMENMKVHGFQLSNGNVFLDFDHIALAMKCIGQIHSMSYASKNRRPDKFQEAIRKLKFRNEFHDAIMQMGLACMKDGVERFKKQTNEITTLNKFLDALEPLEDLVRAIKKPVEPFAVVFHGDFCNNNVFFKYNENGKPIDCAVFDFQFAGYGSPAVDLAFFLYMHTNEGMREEHWDEFLQIYWKSVEDNVPADVRLPTFEEFLKYFATKAVYGYFPCSFFLPLMAHPNEIIPMDEYFAKSMEEKVDYFLNIGGEKGRKLAGDIVSHLLKKKYLHSFLEWYETVRST